MGLDSGYVAIAEADSTRNLSSLLDRLNSEHALPKVILFPLNPKMYQESMALLGCFQGESKGKMQLGAAWWFNDNEPGIRKQLATFAENGHLGTFLGMLTDSRSFISYPRHQYFRRILCDYLGTMMEEGKMSNDLEEVETVVRDICYNNALAYFGLED